MITQKTAANIWNAYREIEAAKKLLVDMKETRERDQERGERHEATLKDAFGRRRHLQLGIPMGDDGHKIFRVAPELGESVIRAHIAKQQGFLVEANEAARIELENPPPGEKENK